MNGLAIIGIGALTPAGSGWAGLKPSTPPLPAQIRSLRRLDTAFPVQRIDDAALLEGASEPRLRRASRITLMLAAAARQALGEQPRKRLGLVGAFFTGPCHFSRRFFEPVIQRGPSFASPALFPETVYNSSLSHLAHLLGVDGSCYAIVGDDSAWVSALQVASLWLDLGQVDAVLVVGGEELDVSALEAYNSAGWLKNGFVPAEGASAILVNRAGGDSAMTITGLTPDFGYRSRASARRAVAECFAVMPEAPIAQTAGRTWLRPLVDRMGADSPATPLPSTGLGHAFTATAGWHTLLAVRALLDQTAEASLWVPVWGLHHQVSALRLQKSDRQQLAVFADARGPSASPDAKSR